MTSDRAATVEAHRGQPTPTRQTLTGSVQLQLPEFEDPPSDPLVLLGEWLEGALENGVREPAALALATADEQGRPSSRIVLLKELDDGLVFTSHHASRKGRELALAPWAAATLYWRETMQQVNIAGTVTQMSEQDSNMLFAERPITAQATTVASCQSEPLADERALRARAESLADRATPLERPAGWGGYRLQVERIEFWHGSPDRLHRRLLYTRDADGWTHQRLQP